VRRVRVAGARARDFGIHRLAAVPAYLATVDASSATRVHPVTPIVGDRRLFLFMEPTSPKGHNLVDRGVFELHCLIPDDNGTGREFYLRGHRQRINSAHMRATAAEAAGVPQGPVEQQFTPIARSGGMELARHGDLQPV
jgi:hypothetical protein